MTWNNHRAGLKNIQERIDKFLFSNNWLLNYPEAQVHHLEDLDSDHRPILLILNSNFSKAKRMFRFDSRWCNKENFEQLVASSQKSVPLDNGTSHMLTNLKLCRHAIVHWNMSHHHNSRIRINSLQEELSTIKQASCWDAENIRRVEKELVLEIQNEEAFQAQKARINWLQQGEYNISFFHAKVIQRRKRNFIVGLLDSSECWRTSLQDIQSIALEYFHSYLLFTEPKGAS